MQQSTARDNTDAAKADRPGAMRGTITFSEELLEMLASRSKDLVVITDPGAQRVEYCNLSSVIAPENHKYYDTLLNNVRRYESEKGAEEWSIESADAIDSRFSVHSYMIKQPDAIRYAHVISGDLKWDSSQNRDGATGLYSRVFCLDRMQEMLSACMRFTVCYLDLDNLSVVNEQYGQRAGDQYIADVVHMLGTSIRREDLFARMGSDEFVVLFKNCSERAIAQKMDAITRALRRNAPETDRAQRGVSYCTVRVDGATSISLDQVLELCNRRMYERRHFGTGV